MIFANSLAVLLALAPATLFAAPTKTLQKRAIPAEALEAIKDGVCDLSAVQMPVAPSPLPSPAANLSLSHVALGRGIQNYTCETSTPSETPAAVGAVANLYNVTCGSARAPDILANSAATALKYDIPESELADHMQSGIHEFTATGVPHFKLSTEFNDYGEVELALNAKSPAPVDAPEGRNGLGSVAWLKLNATEGNWQFKEVYRVRTAGGVAPKNCEGLEAGKVYSYEYAAEYWFYA